MMAVLYDVSVPTVSEHIKKIYEDGELAEQATVRKFRTVQTEGARQVSRELTHYNLQMIISVGFKVNNERAVQFRKWANQIVKDYTIQGWVMDDERLKNAGAWPFGKPSIKSNVTSGTAFGQPAVCMSMCRFLLSLTEPIPSIIPTPPVTAI